jgi:hypothetical protein
MMPLSSTSSAEASVHTVVDAAFTRIRESPTNNPVVPDDAGRLPESILLS